MALYIFYRIAASVGMRIDSAKGSSKVLNGTKLRERAESGVSAMHFITDKICSLQLCCHQRIEAPTGRYVARLPEEIGSQNSLTVTQYWASANS